MALERQLRFHYGFLSESRVLGVIKYVNVSLSGLRCKDIAFLRHIAGFVHLAFVEDLGFNFHFIFLRQTLLVLRVRGS